MSKFYDLYHSKLKKHTKIISGDNFTYINHINVIKSVLDNKRVNRSLDIGSSTGTISFFLSKFSKYVVGVDISEVAYKAALVNRDNLMVKNVYFVNKSIGNFRSNKRFDLITMFEVLEHLRSDERMLKKVYSLLTKKGYLILSVPSKSTVLYKLGLLRKFDKKVGHLRRYDKHQLTLLLSKYNLRVVNSYAVESPFRNVLFLNDFFGILIKSINILGLSKFINCLDNFLVRFFGESQIIVVCVKK